VTKLGALSGHQSRRAGIDDPRGVTPLIHPGAPGRDDDRKHERGWPDGLSTRSLDVLKTIPARRDPWKLCPYWPAPIPTWQSFPDPFSGLTNPRTHL